MDALDKLVVTAICVLSFAGAGFCVFAAVAVSKAVSAGCL